uniref:7-methyl-GTP pyrophosphatase n=1 Tax=Candidatus Kentrum sp. FM TaxID=2126340 RepID=A0A450TPF4_9GAMM|nr:MAG: MAF protein [Candidatus Kentron sp. FM]VFJ74783.1 MAG: MAF protein [Candidatus Kentron sp. FM]VFK17801.1 MAG: MAF protein [Candidatus Kentron sp. FM]
MTNTPHIAPPAFPPIVLASTSVYRRGLLSRLGLAFETQSPTTDERPLAGETPRALVYRLAKAKARSIAAAMAPTMTPDHPAALIIGSDQVAVLDDTILGKPGDLAATIEQLSRAAGRRVTFLTGVCVLNTETGKADVDVVAFSVLFRKLTGRQIRNYAERERPFDCAGGFKSESLGVALFERMEGEDPTALVGLPLIRLTDMLARQGVDVLGG